MKKLLLSAALLLGSGAAFADDAPPPADPMMKCKGCHGPELAGKAKSPAIAGMDKAKIVESLTTKVPKPMAAVVKQLTPEQITTLADKISKLPKVAAPEAPPPG